MIVRRPPATVLGAVGVGASNQLFRLSHIRRVHEFLQLGPSRPQSLLFVGLERRCGLTARDPKRSRLLSRSECAFNCSKLVLVCSPLRELLLRPVVVNVERALRMIREALACDASRGLCLSHSLSRGLATDPARHRTANSSHRFL